jgi:hypothetical protein
MPDITDFQIGQGETFKAKIQLMDRTDNNTPLDITSYTFSGQMRENYTTDEIAAEFTFSKIEPYASGSVFIQLSPEQTAALTQRKYVYDVKFASGSVTRRILEGTFTARPSVTR